MGRLERHLDLDLIARIEAGIRFKSKPVKRQRKRRDRWSYRAGRRQILRDRRAAELHERRAARGA